MNEKYFLDGHSRVYVDGEDGCKQHGKDAPIFHLYKTEKGKNFYLTVIRCPRSLSHEEQAKIRSSVKSATGS